MTIAISSHGTIIRRAPAATPSTFTVIGELGDIQMPGLNRNEFDATPHNRDIDSYVMGVLRRDPVTFPIFFHKDNPTHDHLTGLESAILENSFDGFMATSPDGSEWVFSGFVRNVQRTAPVDGIQTANVTIRASGPFWLNGVLIGADVIE